MQCHRERQADDETQRESLHLTPIAFPPRNPPLASQSPDRGHGRRQCRNLCACIITLSPFGSRHPFLLAGPQQFPRGRKRSENWGGLFADLQGHVDRRANQYEARRGGKLPTGPARTGHETNRACNVQRSESQTKLKKGHAAIEALEDIAPRRQAGGPWCRPGRGAGRKASSKRWDGTVTMRLSSTIPQCEAIDSLPADATLDRRRLII